MKIAAISDVHIKKSHDEAYEILLRFLKNPFVKDSNYVVFLGDIFDLMCGPHNHYLKMYKEIFQEIRNFIDQGKKIYFFEGNHDVHLEGLFNKFFVKRSYILSQVPITEIIDGKKYLFSHGDEYDISNENYQRYKKILLSPPLKFLAEYVMPFSILNYLGNKASKTSRKKGSLNFDENIVRQKFRIGIEYLRKEQELDFILGGHSHVKDQYLMENKKTIYLNNGYALKEKTFIAIENHKVEFLDLK